MSLCGVCGCRGDAADECMSVRGLLLFFVDTMLYEPLCCFLSGHKALRVELTLVVMNSFTIQTPQTTPQRQKQARDPRQAQPKRSLHLGACCFVRCTFHTRPIASAVGARRKRGAGDVADAACAADATPLGVIFVTLLSPGRT